MMIAVGIILGLKQLQGELFQWRKVGNLIEFTKKGVIWDQVGRDS